MEKSYIFTSERLGFRNWDEADIPAMAVINSDKAVMAHFPRPLTFAETEALVKRFQKHFQEKGYTYYAVDLLEDGCFIGFIGLAYQDFEASFTPCVDIGWRLAPSAWDKGYATEGAKKCLHYAFESLGLEEIKSHCPVENTKSRKVMEKIGMKPLGTFIHPKLKGNELLEECFLYSISK